MVQSSQSVVLRSRLDTNRQCYQWCPYRRPTRAGAHRLQLRISTAGTTPVRSVVVVDRWSSIGVTCRELPRAALPTYNAVRLQCDDDRHNTTHATRRNLPASYRRRLETLRPCYTLDNRRASTRAAVFRASLLWSWSRPILSAQLAQTLDCVRYTERMDARQCFLDDGVRFWCLQLDLRRLPTFGTCVVYRHGRGLSCVVTMTGPRRMDVVFRLASYWSRRDRIHASQSASETRTCSAKSGGCPSALVTA